MYSGPTPHQPFSRSARPQDAAPPSAVEPLEPRTLLAGNGLIGTYFNSANLTERAFVRVDRKVAFNWQNNSPHRSVAPDTFSARWTGQVKAPFTQRYTFHTVSDDGVRLWVGKKLVIDQWNVHPTQEHTGTVSLVKGRKYNIRLEYFEQSGGAAARLMWSSRSVRKQAVAPRFLFATSVPIKDPAPSEIPPAPKPPAPKPPPVAPKPPPTAPKPPPTPPPAPKPPPAPTPPPAPKPPPAPTPPPAPKPPPAPVPPPSPTPQPPPNQRAGALRVSSNGRYFVKADGKPFFMLADTAWRMPTELTASEVDIYLKNRASKGFNTIQICLVDEYYKHKNRAGQAAFHNNDTNKPNHPYFDFCELIVTKAASYGMQVAIMPSWGRNVAHAGDRIFSVGSGYSFGKYLGNRFRDNPNVMWLTGGDWAISDNTTREIWKAMAKGLAEGGNNQHLITFHPRGAQSSGQYFQGESWLDYNTIQSGYSRDSAIWDFVSREYQRNPAKPIFDGEPNYENVPVGIIQRKLDGPKFDAYDVRKKAWWAVFAGAAGAAYGANEVFQFWTPGKFRVMGAHVHWQQAMDFAGAGHLKHLRNLMESRSYLSRIPDQSLVTSSHYGSTDRIQATRDSGGAYAFVYSASGKSFTVNLEKLSGSNVKAAWYDPRTGQIKSIGTFARKGTQAFTPPTHGYGQDWVLTLDRA